MSIIKRDILYKFNQILDNINFSSLYYLLVGESHYFSNPLPGYYYIKQEIPKLPQNYHDLFKFFALGEPILLSSLYALFDEDILNHLYELEVLNRDEDYCWLNNLLLVTYENLYFFVGNCSSYPTNQDLIQRPYVGIDTYWLSRIVSNKLYGRVLDLCTGSGIQALIAAKTANEVIAIDVDPLACKIAKINVFLNKLDDTIKVYQSDLYSVLNKSEKFDFIISNPPFMPVPDSVNFPISGNGGSDGKCIIKIILQGYSNFLKRNGTAYMTGQALGNSQNVFLTDDLKSCLCEMSVNVIYFGKNDLKNQAIEYAKLSNYCNNNNCANKENWLSIYRDIGAEYLYNYILTVKNSESKYDEIFLDDNWNITDIPQTNCTWTIAPNNYILSTNEKNNITVSDEVLEFIKRIDGKKTLEEIVEGFPVKYKIKYGENAEKIIQGSLIRVCGNLQRQKIITKVIPN